MKKNLKKGFTLTELVVVIVIIGILASVLIPTLTSYITRSRKSAAEQEATARLQEAAAYVLDKDNEAWFAWNEFMKGTAVEVKASNDYYVLFDGGQLKQDKTATGAITEAKALLTFTAANTSTIKPAFYTLTLDNDIKPSDLTGDTLAVKLEKAFGLDTASGVLYVVLNADGSVSLTSTNPLA